MDLEKLITDVLAAAKTAATVIPGMQGAALAISIGEKLAAALDDLIDGAPDTRSQDEMLAARRDLAAAVSAKAERTADRFD